jgi:hypothetical protein
MNGEHSPESIRANVNTDLDGLVDLAAETDHHIIIEDRGVTVGVVTKRGLLRGIQGNTKNAN